MRTNYADLAMGNAIFIYQADYAEQTEVGPHIRATYVLDDTPAGPLECDVWREVSMLTGEPVLKWNAEYRLNGAVLAPWQLQDMGLHGELETPETPGTMFGKWAAVRVRIKKDDRRVVDWPTVADLHMDFRSWARRRGVPDDMVPSLKAFSALVRNMAGVEPTRMGARGTHMVFLELLPQDERPAMPVAQDDEVTAHELRQARYKKDREDQEAMLAAVAERRKPKPPRPVDPDSPWVNHHDERQKPVKPGARKQ